MTSIVREIEIQSRLYQGQSYFRISYVREDGEVEESSLYTTEEILEILKNWQEGKLLGSFGIGHRLAENYVVRASI